MPDFVRRRSLIAGLAVVLLAAAAPSEVAAQAGIEWHEVTSSEGVVPVGLVRPEPGTEAPHPVVFALPWGGGTPDLVETFVASYWLTEPPARGYYVVAPAIAGPRLAGPGDELLTAIFAWMDAELDHAPDRVALVGASNGGRGAFLAALARPDRFGALMTLPGQYAGPAEDLASLAGKPIYFLVGERDERWVESTEATRRALASQGIASGLWVVPGQGHVLRVDPRPLMDWIDSALER